MGYGGALIWTGLARNIVKNIPDKKLVLIFKKSFKNIVLNRNNPDHVVYKNNDDIFLITNKFRWFFIKHIYNRNKIIVVDMDDKRYHYWSDDTPEKISYKSDQHAIQYAVEPFKFSQVVLSPKIILSKSEKENSNNILQQAKLQTNRYICIQPNFKSGYFVNRQWFWKRWQELVDRLNKFINDNHLDIKIVQVGVSEEKLLKGIIDITGRTTFREMAQVIEQSLTLISCDGGLAHLASAVNKKSVILNSGSIPPKLMTYPLHVNILCTTTCRCVGLKSDCQFDRQCMNSITVNRVYNPVVEIIRASQQ